MNDDIRARVEDLIHANEEYFLNRATFHGARFQRDQVAVQEWNDAGQIVKETFFYAG